MTKLLQQISGLLIWTTLYRLS